MQQHTALTNSLGLGHSLSLSLVSVYQACIWWNLHLHTAPDNRQVWTALQHILHHACCQVPHLQRHLLHLLTAVQQYHEHLIIRLGSKDITTSIYNSGITIDIPLGIERQNFTSLQGHMLIAKMNQTASPHPKLRISVFPVISTTAIRIPIALQGNLITIINTRHPWEGHLPQDSHLGTHQALVETLSIQTIASLTHCRHPLLTRSLPQQGQDTLSIMTAQKIHHGIEIVLRIILLQAPQSNTNLASICIAQKEVQHSLTERIVHSRIQFLTTEILTGYTIGALVGSILPDLPQHNCILIHLLQFLVEGLSKLLWQLIHHIQAPTANALLHPIFQHTILIIDNEIHIGWGFFLHIWQGAEPPPAFIALWIFVETIPFIIW